MSRVAVAPPGSERDRRIHASCAAVWEAYGGNRATIAELPRRHEIL